MATFMYVVELANKLDLLNTKPIKPEIVNDNHPEKKVEPVQLKLF